jgi:feruloyl esterase
MADRADGAVSRAITRILAVALAASALAAAPDAAHAQAFANAGSGAVDYTAAEVAPAQTCAALGALSLDDVIELAAVEVPASDAVPAHCVVTGVIAPAIAFEVALPERWNGRFFMTGNGGLAGDQLDNPGRVAQRRQAVALGFAFGQTNTGHYASEEPGGTFVLSDPQKAIDYAYRAVHETAVIAKAIAADYYGDPVSYSYWASCSNGGRQGLIEAQRYPEDFDGVVANAPWVNQTAFAVGAVWNHQAMSGVSLTPGKLALLAEHVTAACDVVDGLPDGLIDDPRRCAFDPRRDAPVCAAGVDDDTCLTAAQAEAAARVYAGVVVDGEQTVRGFMPGSEVVSGGFGGGPPVSAWLGLIAPAQPGAGTADFGLADNIMKYLVFDPPQPEWDYATFDFARDIPLLDAWGEQANALETDLSAFDARGGKIIMTYGWSDQVLQPLMGVDYYEDVLAAHGPRARDFVRLFMVPGMTHCAGGVGPDQMDAVSAVIDWVEAGRAPDSLLASKRVAGEVVRTRPLCPYPQVARYRGQGSIDDAENFACAAPPERPNPPALLVGE